MAKHTPLMPHGDIEEVFPDVFFVTGTTRPNFGGVNFQYSRNMTIVRDKGALTLINTVRLDGDGLAHLDDLGNIENVVKLGAFHGIDDAFYLARYGAKQWALPGAEHFGGQTTDAELKPDGPMPAAGASVFVFETSNQPEPDEYFDEDTAIKMCELGFIRPANIGPGWLRGSEPEAIDFARLKQLTFRHLLPAHGRPIRDQAHEQLSATFARDFNV